MIGTVVQSPKRMYSPIPSSVMMMKDNGQGKILCQNLINKLPPWARLREFTVPDNRSHYVAGQRQLCLPNILF